MTVVNRIFKLNILLLGIIRNSATKCPVSLVDLKNKI